MTIGGINQCEICVNRYNNLKGAKCEAYPDGIPDALYSMAHFHTKPFKGDNGIKFELDENSSYKAYLPQIIQDLKRMGMDI